MRLNTIVVVLLLVVWILDIRVFFRFFGGLCAKVRVVTDETKCVVCVCAACAALYMANTIVVVVGCVDFGYSVFFRFFGGLCAKVRVVLL